MFDKACHDKTGITLSLTTIVADDNIIVIQMVKCLLERVGKAASGLERIMAEVLVK